MCSNRTILLLLRPSLRKLGELHHQYVREFTTGTAPWQAPYKSASHRGSPMKVRSTPSLDFKRGLETHIRPANCESLTVETPHPRIVLAGDGIRCDFPVALMERAATTGFLAANQLLSSWRVAGHDLWTVPMRSRHRAAPALRGLLTRSG